jgi:hypothetical protein
MGQTDECWGQTDECWGQTGWLLDIGPLNLKFIIYLFIDLLWLGR